MAGYYDTRGTLKQFSFIPGITAVEYAIVEEDSNFSDGGSLIEVDFGRENYDSERRAPLLRQVVGGQRR